MPDSISYEAPANTPNALPAPIPPKLVGRDALLGQIYTQLRGNVPVQINGAPGIGKTALAATLAAAYTEQPGGVLWLNVDNSTVEELLVRVGRAYNVPQITGTDNPLAMIGAVANVLTQHKPLVVLDGKIDEQVATAFIERCVTNLPALVVTTAPVSEVWKSFDIPTLEGSHSAALFRQIGGVQDGPDPDVDRLVSLFRHTPLALVIAAGAMRGAKQTPAQFASVVVQIPDYNSIDPSLVALTAALRTLSSAVQGLILLMGATFNRQACPELLSAVGNAPQDTIQQVMNQLAQQYLVERLQRYGVPYYRLHETTATFAQGWLRGSQRLETLQMKMRDAILAYARKYSNPDRASHDKLAAEMESFVSAAQWAAAQNDRDTANQLILSLTQAGDFLKERGYLHELLLLRRLAITSTTAFPYAETPAAAPQPPSMPEEDKEAAAVAGSSLFSSRMFEEVEAEASELDEDEDAFDDEGELDVEVDEIEDELDIEEDGDEDDFDEIDDEGEEEVGLRRPLASVDEAIADIEAALPPAPSGDKLSVLRAALIQARQQGNKPRQGELLKAIGEAQVEQRMENEAIATYSEVLTVYEEMGNDRDLLDALDTLAALMVRTENAQPAVLHAMRGVRLAETLGDFETQMQMLITLGDARQQLGETDNAQRAFEQALEIARTVDDAQNEALILFKLGYAQLENGDAEGASQTWEQALKLFRQQNRRAYEGRVMGGLGTAYGELKAWSEAISFHTSALHIAREVQDREEEALQLSNLGYALVQADQLGQAVLRYRQALHLAYQSGNRENVVNTVLDLARLLTRSPRHLAIAQLLVEDALLLEPYHRELRSLKEQVAHDILSEEAHGVRQASVTGSARDYAANAYKLLEEA